MKRADFKQNVEEFSTCLTDYFSIDNIEYETDDDEDDEWMAYVTVCADHFGLRWSWPLHIHSEHSDRLGIYIEDCGSLDADVEGAMTYLAFTAISRLQDKMVTIEKLEKNAKLRD